MDNPGVAPEAPEYSGSSHFETRITAAELLRLIGTSSWRPAAPTLSAQILIISGHALMAARGPNFERCSPVLDAVLSSDDTMLVVSLIPIAGHGGTVVLRRES